MKVCKKCNREYKDEYVFCPKCGKPYDDKKRPVKTPIDYDGGVIDTIYKLFIIFLYLIGSIFIIISLVGITKNVFFSIIGLFFGLSFFKAFYDLIENQTKIDSFIITIMRIGLPLVLFIMWLFFFPRV